MKTEPTSPYLIEDRVRTESGWKTHGSINEYGDREVALAAFDAQVAEHREAYASGEWKLVLLGPDRTKRGA